MSNCSMDTISEVAALDAVKSKSKKSSASETVADAVSTVDMNHDSNEKNGKDRSRKEKKEKNISGIDMKDRKREKKKKKNQLGSVEEASNVLEASDREVHVGSEHIGCNDLKTRKKEKIMAKDKKNMNYGNNTDTKVDEVVGSDLKQLKEGKEQAREGHLKKKKMIEPKRKEIIDVELVKGQEGKAREKEKLKKKSNKNKKELSRTEHDYACENGSVGHDGSVEPAPDRKRKKKKREDLGTELLHDTSSKKRKEKSGTPITGDTCISASVGSEWDPAAGDDDVAEKVSSNEDKKKKEEKGDSSSLNNVENCGSGGSKKKNKKSKGSDTERDADAGVSKTNKRKKVIEMSEKSTSSKKSKRVRFSGKDEVFSLPGGSSQGKKEQDGNKSDDGLVRGKRFSKEEDELVKKAVLDYIETHQLGEEGIQMVMKCKSYPEIKDCWKEIGESLPWRPSTAVYYRAHILFERCESREWTEEEIELVRKFHEKHGADWRTLADELGKHRIHVKDTWRRIKLPNRKKNGHWSQEEYQALFELVNTDLSLKAFQEKKSKHGMLRDNISWEAISEKHGTRTTPTCCYKWYNQLTSPLVAEGKWSDTDDYRLLIALVDLDAACEADVDWDNLLEHRSGEICRKRWNQMVHHIGESMESSHLTSKLKSFPRDTAHLCWKQGKLMKTNLILIDDFCCIGW